MRRPRNLKRWCSVAVAVVIGGVGVLNLLAYRHAYAMTHFTGEHVRIGKPESMSWGEKLRVLVSGVEIGRPRSSVAPTALSAQCRSLSLPGTNGIRLGAWYCQGEVGKPLVILFHGYTGEKSGTVAEARILVGMGLSVLLVDFRGSGESSESYTSVGYCEAEDVAAATRYGRETLGHARIVLYGQSMGAAAVLRAVHSCGVRADGLIVEAVFDRMLNTVRHRFELMRVPAFPGAELLVFWGGRQMGFNGFGHNPVTYAAAVNCPVLFIHGKEDPRARVEEGRRVYEAVPGVKWFKEFEGVQHEGPAKRFPAEWGESVRSFLAELPPGGASLP